VVFRCALSSGCSGPGVIMMKYTSSCKMHLDHWMVVRVRDMMWLQFVSIIIVVVVVVIVRSFAWAKRICLCVLLWLLLLLCCCCDVVVVAIAAAAVFMLFSRSFVRSFVRSLLVVRSLARWFVRRFHTDRCRLRPCTRCISPFCCFRPPRLLQPRPSGAPSASVKSF
jgi:hypothetical protein